MSDAISIATGRVASLISLTNPAVLTVAHRGDWSHAPENSLPAIRDCIAAGVEIVEFDTQPTSDGHLIVIHDETYDRTSTLSGAIETQPLSRVREARLRAGDGIDKPLTGERIPTLAEALEEARNRIVVNIDTKYEVDLPGVTKIVLDLGMADNVIIKSAVDSWHDVALVREMPFFGHLPYMPKIRLDAARATEHVEIAKALGSGMIEARFDHFADLLAARAACLPANIRLWINTLDVSYPMDFNDRRALNDPDGVWGTLIRAGVGAIQTDQIAFFRSWVQRAGF
jgi:glycerophosphoryl diester phosphodiesterase